MLAHLPHDLLALLPLDAPVLGALACTNAALRDGVAAVRCARGIHIPAHRLPCLRSDRHAPLRSLRVHGPFYGPLPRAFPRLESLRLDGCRVRDWERLARDAPALRRLALRVPFEGPTYAPALRSLRTLLESAAALWPALEELEVHGHGMVVWRVGGPPRTRAGWSAVADALAAADEAVAMPPARLPPSLTRLELTGRQFAPSVAAGPRLEHAVLEEPEDERAVMATRAALDGLRSLTWSVRATVPPVSFPHLTGLDLTVRDIEDVGAALASLARLPPTLEHLRVDLDYMRLADMRELVVLDGSPLAGLTRLRALHLVLSFPPRGDYAQLVGRLLGAPAACLQTARLEAEHGPAFAARQWRDYLLRDEDADPEDESMRELGWEIEEIERASAVPRECLDAAAAAFPNAAITLDGGFVIV